MNPKQVQKFVTRYLEATGCRLIEKSPAHVTVKLSPEADKDLTNRPYYWGFVERTGVEPETMTLTFVFDPDKMLDAAAPKPAQPQPPVADSILGRYLGVSPIPATASRIPRETVTYGSRRLLQLFGVVKAKGRFVQLYEEPGAAKPAADGLIRYSSWMVVNFKVELVCDMKRDELHSLAVTLETGRVVEGAMERLTARRWSPKLPARSYIPRPQLTLHRAMTALEQWLEKSPANTTTAGRTKPMNAGWMKARGSTLITES